MEILTNPTFIWFSVGLAMLLFEMAAPGLFMLFFGLGAWVVMAITLFINISLNSQLVVFLITSIISLVLFRNILKKAFHGHETDNQDLGIELDEFIGQKATVVKKIFPNVGGKVEFKGSQWEAVAKEEIDEGAIVKIIEKDNITLIVVKL